MAPSSSLFFLRCRYGNICTLKYSPSRTVASCLCLMMKCSKLKISHSHYKYITNNHTLTHNRPPQPSPPSSSSSSPSCSCSAYPPCASSPTPSETHHPWSSTPETTLFPRGSRGAYEQQRCSTPSFPLPRSGSRRIPYTGGGGRTALGRA